MSNVVSLALPREPARLEQELHAWFEKRPSALVALSGGVDSSVVAAMAARALGPRALAVTGVSPSLATHELAEIRAFAAARDLRHLTVDTHEHERTDYARNTPDRCYFCKSELFDTLGRVAKAEGVECIVDGTNADDLGAHRPGKRAGDERSVQSPLVELGFTKDEVRRLAGHLGLANADRPSAPCLASRIAYGVPVTPERLRRVGAAEAALRAHGFRELRVRLHGPIARIEVPKNELARAVELAAAIHEDLRQLGFAHVTLDLAGLRSGSLLESAGPLP